MAKAAGVGVEIVIINLKSVDAAYAQPRYGVNVRHNIAFAVGRVRRLDSAVDPSPGIVFPVLVIRMYGGIAKGRLRRAAGDSAFRRDRKRSPDIAHRRGEVCIGEIPLAVGARGKNRIIM